jgi:hypothetical protein
VSGPAGGLLLLLLLLMGWSALAATGMLHSWASQLEG